MTFDPSRYEATAREVVIRLAVCEALAELLIQKGVVTREEWNWRAAACRTEVEKKLNRLPSVDDEMG